MLASTLTVCLLYFVVSSEAQRVDCRKFVFAPMCRGVAAKRGFAGAQPEFYMEQDRKIEGGQMFYPTIPPMGVVPEGLSVAGRDTSGHSRPAWRSEAERMPAQKVDTMYDWYLNNRKQPRESDLAYDY